MQILCIRVHNTTCILFEFQATPISDFRQKKLIFIFENFFGKSTIYSKDTSLCLHYVFAVINYAQLSVCDGRIELFRVELKKV